MSVGQMSRLNVCKPNAHLPIICLQNASWPNISRPNAHLINIFWQIVCWQNISLPNVCVQNVAKCQLAICLQDAFQLEKYLFSRCLLVKCQLPNCLQAKVFCQISILQMPVGQMLIGLLSVGQFSVCKIYVGQMFVGQMFVGQMFVGQMFVGQMFRLNVCKPSVRLLVCGQKSCWPSAFRPKGVEAWKLPKTKIRYQAKKCDQQATLKKLFGVIAMKLFDLNISFQCYKNFFVYP